MTSYVLQWMLISGEVLVLCEIMKERERERRKERERERERVVEKKKIYYRKKDLNTIYIFSKYFLQKVQRYI